MIILSFLFSSAQAQDPEFGQVEVQFLPEVVIYACRSGKVPCFPGRADLGCVQEGLEPKAFEKACEKYKLALEEFQYDCFVTFGGKRNYVGKTRTAEVCTGLQAVWEQLSDDPFFKDRSADWRMSFMRNTLLKPRGSRRKDNPGLAGQLRFKRSGKLRKSSDDVDRLLEKAQANLEDYRAETSCGSGIVPGIDQVPVLNQRAQGTCYAHSSSTLIDYVRKTRSGQGYPVYGSPLMGAIDYHLNATDPIESCKNPFNGGFTCNAFNATVSRGFCSSQKIEQAIQKTFLVRDGSKKQSWYLDWAKKQNLTVTTQEFKIKPSDPVNEYLYVIGSLYQEKNWDRLKELHDSLKAGGIAPGEQCRINPKGLDLSWELMKLSPNLELFYGVYFDSVCEREPFPFKAGCATHRSGITTGKVDELLSKGYPIGINYCSAILKNSKFKSPTQPIWKDNNACGSHASVIVGTAVDSKGQCTYVLRNSWGKDCKKYDRSYDCKDGHVYIPKETLVQQMFELQEISVH